MSASSAATQSSDSARMRSTVCSPSASNSASAGGKRAVAASSGSSSTTSTSCVHGTRASVRLTNATASKSGGGGVARAGDPDRAEAVGAQRARLAAPVVVRGHVPAPAVGDEPVRAELALGLDALARRVARLDAPPADHGLGQQQQVLAARRRRAARPAGDLKRLLERLDPQPHAVRQHAVELGQRAVGVEPVAPRGEQAERDRGRLAGGEEQRRHPVAGSQPVAAGRAALGLDRDAERAQRLDVAPHRARVDAEPRGQLGPAGRRAVLERLQQLEHAVGLRHRGQILP